MEPVTLFSFGYFGWGNCTPKLVEIVDAVERSRGFAPPVFVDIRIRRSVRARGFNGPAFERLLGPARYRWMSALGNRHIVSRRGPFIQIAHPEAAAELVSLAVEQGKRGARLLFFCGCRWPREGGEIACHRCSVARLVVEAAQQRGQPVSVIEWPGGAPDSRPLEWVPAMVIAKGRKTLPLGRSVDLACAGGIAWGSVVKTAAPAARLVGPAIWHGDQWVLPLLGEPIHGDDEWRCAAAVVRRDHGLEPLST